ncbi:pentapeptide repeat-containing protein [Aeromonas eucrenophila]|uniref:Pentapeptide repeat-containing protein n=1 Tax=Aeromonas eucrenophila TaxID=649 RepID=A0ABW0YK15_9GAMM
MGTSFIGASLIGTSFIGASLIGTSFIGASLIGTSLIGTKRARPCQLPSATSTSWLRRDWLGGSWLADSRRTIRWLTA